jgi:uncharacterized membrane protein YbaN (DUF454 family)
MSIKKFLLAGIGFLATALGILGIFIPLLPTTPFLILAAYCFLRSSNRWYNWLIHHKLLGKYIYNYLKYKAVPFKTKISALIILWGSLTFSIILTKNLHILIFLIAVGIGVSIHLLSLRTIRDDEMKSGEPAREKNEPVNE